MDFWKSVVVLFGSLFAGFFGGQVGGGGLLTLPILLLVGLNPLIALGTNRFAAVFPNFISTVIFFREKKVSLKHYFIFGGIALMGGITGAVIINHLNPDSLLLKKFLLGAVFFVAILLFSQKKLGLIENEFKLSRKHYFIFMVLVFILSVYGGSLGVALTTFFALLFTAKKQSFIQAMSYAMFLSFIVSISSTVAFMLSAHVDYFYGFLQGFGGGVGGYLGSKYAIKKGNHWIRNVTFLLILGLLIKLFFEIY